MFKADQKTAPGCMGFIDDVFIYTFFPTRSSGGGFLNVLKLESIEVIASILSLPTGLTSFKLEMARKQPLFHKLCAFQISPLLPSYPIYFQRIQTACDTGCDGFSLGRLPPVMGRSQ
jgi:hypothetical protein